MIRFLKDIRNIAALVLITLFLIKAQDRAVRFIFWVLGGVVFSCAFDLAIDIIFFKKLVRPKSALITGLILSGILDYNQPWYVLVVFSTLAISSKHILKFKGRHIFNPANFGLFAATLFRIPLTWSIESHIPLIIVAGAYFAWSLRKIAHIAGFLIFFTPLFAIAKINPFGIVSWFFLAFMLIEPKTSGYGLVRGLIFGSIAGISCFLAFKFFPAFDYFVASLFIANLFNPVLERIRSS